jgi:hypothetical protein
MVMVMATKRCCHAPGAEAKQQRNHTMPAARESVGGMTTAELMMMVMAMVMVMMMTARVML